jgi:hypothetical protein
MRRPLYLGVLIALFAAATAACGDDTPPTQPTPTPTPVTETYTGTLSVNGAITFPNILVSQAGSANATISSLRPELTMRVAAGGTGNFVVGETVFVGESLETASGTAVVHGWNPSQRALFINSRVGTLTLGQALVGATSGASWVNEEVTSTVVGLALGTWSGTTCTIVLANDISGTGSLVSGVVQSAGTLCARVYDVGRILVPVDFTIEVTHF